MNPPNDRFLTSRRFFKGGITASRLIFIGDLSKRTQKSEVIIYKILDYRRTAQLLRFFPISRYLLIK